jgi:hypothetical protein
MEAVTQAGRETPAATEMPIVAEAAVRHGKVLTRKAAAESPARTVVAEPAAPMSTTTETATVSTPTMSGAHGNVATARMNGSL